MIESTRVMFRAAVAVVVLGGSAPGLAGAAPAAELPAKLDIEDKAAPFFSVYSTEDGLSDEIWNSVGLDRKGFVWAGSASELARFDGYRWTPWPFPEAKSLVADLRRDSGGTLWAIFEGDGLARYSGGQWSLVGDVPGPYRGFWSTPLPGSDGARRLWVMGGGRLFWLEKGEWIRDEKPLPPRVLLGLGFAQTESLYGGRRQWIGSMEGGLWYREVDSNGDSSSEWRPFEDPEIQSMPVNYLSRSADRGREQLWILSYGGGVGRLRSDGNRRWRAVTGELPTEALYQGVTTTSRDGESTFWVASRAGLLRIRGDSITVYDQRHGLPSTAVRKVMVRELVDGTDVLWLATEGGMARAALRETPWQTVSLLGARSNGTFAVLVEPDGDGGERLWVGSAMEGLSLLEGGEWRHFGPEDGTLPTRGVRAIFRLPGKNGRPWRLLSLLGGQLLEIADDTTFEPVAQPWPLVNEAAANFALPREVEGEWEYWFATSHDGIYRLRGDEWTQFSIEGGTDHFSVLNLVEQVDDAGRSWIWAATTRGLARFDGESWALVDESPGLLGYGLRFVTVFAEDAGPVLWLGTDRQGIVRLDVTDPVHPTVLTGSGLPPPPDPTVYSILPDSQGRLWVCTNNGVQQLTRDEDGGWNERVFRRSDGLVHDECNTNAQLVDAHDRYWLGTLGGLSVYEPRILQSEERWGRAPLYFTGIRVDGVEESIPGSHVVAVAPATRELGVSYSLLTGLREVESTYRSQLVGYEPSPSAWTNEHFRSFTGLPPGTYRMVVEARDWAGVASSPIELTLQVAPLWWERRWVQMLLGIALILLAWGGVLLYNRRLLRQQRVLQREVAARTAELRSANEQLTDLSYRDPLTGVANRRQLLEGMDRALARASEKGLPLGVIVADVDHFKDYNDRWGHLTGDVALRAVAQALEQSCREQDLVARFGGEEFVCLVVDADAATIASLAERMRLRVESIAPRQLGNDQQGLTISLGMVSRVPSSGDQATDLLSAADEALYKAKRTGRNCVRGL